MINWIQTWFKSQCDGDWEHNYGISITTIDNPGWEVTIDLGNTTNELNEMSWELWGDLEKSWIGFKIENRKFNGACDPLNLNNLLQIFKHLVENGSADEVKKAINL